MKHGQTLTIEGLPVGTTYTVTEDVPVADGYEQTAANVAKTGTIDDDTTETATFTNERNVGKPDHHQGAGRHGHGRELSERAESYHIKVELTAPKNVDLVGSYTAPIAEQSGTLDETATAEGRDQDARIRPQGRSKRRVHRPAGRHDLHRHRDELHAPRLRGTEFSAGSATRYCGETEDGVKYVTGAIPGEEGKNSVAITVANERNTGSLSVEKTVIGTGAQTEKDFTFTLQLTNTGVKLEGAYPATINGVKTDDVEVDANGQATLILKDGETITIKGIPTGTAYTVTETYDCRRLSADRCQRRAVRHHRQRHDCRRQLHQRAQRLRPGCRKDAFGQRR